MNTGESQAVGMEAVHLAVTTGETATSQQTATSCTCTENNTITLFSIYSVGYEIDWVKAPLLSVARELSLVLRNLKKVRISFKCRPIEKA